MNFTQNAQQPPPTIPSGWQAHWDRSSSRYYYHATSTGLSTWTLPAQPPLPPTTPTPPTQPVPLSSPYENPEEVYDEARHILIVDRSGSMQSFGSETPHALKAYLEGVTEKYGSKSKVTFITFDNEIEIVAKNEAPSLQIQPAWIQPRGTTALRDAMVKGIEVGNEEYKSCQNSGKKVELFLACFTDGADNASISSPSALAALIAEHKAKGNWDFTFLAANQDAITSAKAIGIDGQNAISVGRARGGMRRAMGSAARKCKKSGFSMQARSSAMTGH